MPIWLTPQPFAVNGLLTDGVCPSLAVRSCRPASISRLSCDVGEYGDLEFAPINGDGRWEVSDHKQSASAMLASFCMPHIAVHLQLS